VLVIERAQSDFYEDVIQTAEKAASAIAASKQGVVSDAAPAKVKVGKRGFTRGAGAAMFYYKHRLENRRGRILVLDTVTLIWCAIVILFAYFMREEGIMPAFVMATYLQLFSVALGRFNRELTKPYIYLLPEPPLLKMIHALRESLPTAILEAIVMFTPTYFFVDITIPELLAVIFARVGFTMLYITGNVIIMRIWHGSSSRGIVMTLYIVTMLLLAAPGIIFAVVCVALGLGETLVVPFIAMTILNLLLSVLGLFLCRNMLQYAELNNN